MTYLYVAGQKKLHVYHGITCYPVVRRERFGARGIHIPYIFPIQWGAVRSYLEFPKPSNSLEIPIPKISLAIFGDLQNTAQPDAVPSAKAEAGTMDAHLSHRGDQGGPACACFDWSDQDVAVKTCKKTCNNWERCGKLVIDLVIFDDFII